MPRLTTINYTESEFLNAEIAVWGLEEVESLIERGFNPILTTQGWTWVLPVQDRKRVAA
jgi:hypothetical protein